MNADNTSDTESTAQAWGFLLGPGLAMLVFFIGYLFLPATKFPVTETHEMAKKEYFALTGQLGIEVDAESCRYGGKQDARRYTCHVSIGSELQLVEKMVVLSWTTGEKRKLSTWGTESGQEYYLSKDGVIATIGCQHSPAKAFCYLSITPKS